MAPEGSSTWLVVETIKKMKKVYIICMKFKRLAISLSSKEIKWSIQDMDTQLAGSVRNSLLSRVQEKRKINHRSNVKCITVILIFGLSCQTLILEDIIIPQLPSSTNSCMFSAELQTRLENTSTQSRNMIHPTKPNGRWSKWTKDFSQTDKEPVSFKEIQKIFWFSVASQASSWKILSYLIQPAMHSYAHRRHQTRYSHSKCQLFSTHKQMQCTPVIFSAI